MTSQRMKPRAMSEWIVAAASSAFCPRRSVQARVSLSPAVKKLMRPSSSLSRRTTSSSADGALPERGRFLGRQFGELRLELQVDALRAVLDREQRLRRQRLEPGRKLAGEVGERTACIDVREHALELGHFLPQLLVAGLRLLRHALEPTLDVVAVGDEQLEPQRLEVVRGDPRPREPVEDDEQRIDLAKVAEQLRTGSSHLDDPDRGRASPCADRMASAIRVRRGSGIAAMPTSPVGAYAGQRVEEGGLARARQPDDPDLERHYAPGICFCSETSARCWSDLIAPSVLPRMMPTSALGRLKTNFSVSTCCCSCERPSISSSMLC